MKRKLTQSEVDELFSLKKEDLNQDLMKEYFAIFKGKDKPRFNTFDYFTLPANKLYNNETITTTIGRYFINFFVLPEKYLKKYGYLNEVLTKKSLGKLENKLGKMLLDDEMTGKEYAEYMSRAEWFSMGTVYFISPTVNFEINNPISSVMKRKDELFAKYEKEIKEGDLNVASKIEGELLNLAKSEIKKSKNLAMDFYDSGEFTFENNYKKTSIMIGGTQNPYSKKIEIMKSNFINGIAKDEFSETTNISLIGGYARGVETQKGGYETKKISNVGQSMELGEKDSDCHTTNYCSVEISDDNKDGFLYRYILENGKLIMLDSENISKYVGKKVKMRSPLFCKSKKICNKCAGDLYYRMNVKNPGLLISTFSGVLMNKSMKKFHDSTVKFSDINVDDYTF